MAESFESQEKAQVAINSEDEDNHQQSPLEPDDPSKDPDWTPNQRKWIAGATAPNSEPGKFPYNLRNTVSKYSWTGDKYRSDPVSRSKFWDEGEAAKRASSETPSRIPGFQTAAKKLFGTKGDPDTRPEEPPEGRAKGAARGSETSKRKVLASPHHRDSRSTSGTSGQPVAAGAHALGEPVGAGTLFTGNTSDSNSFPSLFAEMKPLPQAAEGGASAHAAAIQALDVFGNKGDWSNAVWGKWEESKEALEEALPILSEFIAKLALVSEADIQNAGSTLSTIRAKLIKDLGGVTLGEKIPTEELTKSIDQLRQDYEDLWRERTDIRKQFHLFLGMGIMTLGKLELVQDAVDAIFAMPPTSLMSMFKTATEAEHTARFKIIRDFVANWSSAFAVLQTFKLEEKQDPSKTLVVKQEVDTDGLSGTTRVPPLNVLMSQLTAYQHHGASSTTATTQANVSSQSGQPSSSGPPPTQHSSGGGTGLTSSTGAGGSGGPGRPVLCALCFRPGHTADNCPGKPDEKKGPYCMNCKKMGHTFYECPLGRFAVPCNHCGDTGHFERDCPVERARQRRVAQREPRTYQDIRLLRKAGIPLDDEDKEDSDIEEIPREDPQETLKRQMKERKRLEAERQVRKLKREEEKQLGMQWAELYRIKEDLIRLLTGKDAATEVDLDSAQQKELTQALVNAYIQQQTKGPKPMDQGSSVAASLKDLGVDGLHQYDGNEAKYPVKQFIRQVDDVKGFKKWPNTTAAIAMSKLLIGNAKDWYEVLRAENQQETPEYNRLKLALLQQFYKKITIVEKAIAMHDLKFDVAKHGSHLNFLTECERQAFIISDQAYSLEADEELITRRQAREEQTLLIFIANSAPLLRWEIEYHGAETKAEIKTVIRRFENALRAKENSPRHALLPGYKVHEVSKPDPATVQKQMEALGYSPGEVNAVVRHKSPKAAGDTVIQCYYCTTVGHRRNECGLLEEDVKKGQVRPDKLGPRAGQAPQVESLSKRRGGSKDKKPKAGSKPTGTKKKKPFFRRKKVSAVEVTDSDNDTEEGDEDTEEVTEPRGSSHSASASPNRTPGAQWNPWMSPYPGTPGWPPFGSTGRPALEAPQTAEVSVNPQRRSAYDLI